MRGTAGAGDHDLEAVLARGLGEFEQALGRAMRRHDEAFVADAELVERCRREAKRLPVGLAAHDDRDRPLSCGHSLAPPGARKQRIIGVGGVLASEASTSVPIPKFVSPCGTLPYEHRNYRDTSNSMILVPL